MSKSGNRERMYWTNVPTEREPIRLGNYRHYGSRLLVVFSELVQMLVPRMLTRQVPQPELEQPEKQPPSSSSLSRSHFSRRERAARTRPLRLARYNVKANLAGSKPVDDPAFSLLVSGGACLTLMS